MGIKSYIKPTDRLIVALDTPSIKEARALVDRLGSSVSFYKLGLELFMDRDYFAFIEFLKAKGKKIFADLKLFDIPKTVERAVLALSKTKVDFVSIHGNDSIIKAAVDALKTSDANLRLLAVTVLTSLDDSDIKSLGFDCSVSELVYSRAYKALDLGCDGIISSGLELSRLRSDDKLKGLIFVCPGIRPLSNSATDDQKRVVTIKDAFKDGADYIVIGRQIRDAKDPYKEALKIQEEITGAL